MISVNKMLILRNTIILICIFCTVHVEGENCDANYEIPNWEPDSSVVPGYLRLGIIPNRPKDADPAIGAQVENRIENITLTLFVNPFILDGNCPNIHSNYSDLRRFHLSHNIIAGDNHHETYCFAKAFTGCYYAEMTNAEGRKWIWPPKFFNTNYTYYDTTLKCKRSDFNPQNDIIIKDLKAELKVPLTCLQVQCKLFEVRKKRTADTIASKKSRILPPLQECWLINNGDGKVPSINCEKPESRVALHAKLVIQEAGNEVWSTQIRWKFMKKYSALYYTSFQVYTHNCNMSYGDLMTWKPVAKISGISYGF